MGLRLSFNQCSHAIVAFSLGDFRVKPPGQSAPDDVEFAPPEDAFRNMGNAPYKEMP